jgi:hypothetical protein
MCCAKRKFYHVAAAEFKAELVRGPEPSELYNEGSCVL